MGNRAILDRAIARPFQGNYTRYDLGCLAGSRQVGLLMSGLFDILMRLVPFGVFKGQPLEVDKLNIAVLIRLALENYELPGLTDERLSIFGRLIGQWQIIE